MVKTTCRELIWKTKNQKQKNLNRTFETSELGNFVRSWIRKFEQTDQLNFSEKLIYLWVTINAWASMVAPQIEMNHQDSYLIHALSFDPTLNKRFNNLYSKNSNFQSQVDKLLDHAPVFQVLWLRNNRLNGWQPGIQSRAEYIREIKDRNPFHNENIPAFAPSCAFEHMEKSEPIPRDLAHVLHTIYQIRCNLFHGGKDYSNKGDRVFIELAYSILWPLFREEFPVHFSQISWEKIFIFTSFLFEKNGEKFDLKKETPENLNYLNKILKNFDLENHLDGYCFTPPQEKFFFDDWTKLLSQINSSSSLKPETQFNFNKLKSVDPYIAGLIRWVNYIGIKANLKGYGPGNRFFIIGFDTNQDYSNFHFSISILSNGQEKFAFQKVETQNIPCFRIPNNPKKILSLAEKFFHNKEKLAEILKLSNGLKRF